MDPHNNNMNTMINPNMNGMNPNINSMNSMNPNMTSMNGMNPNMNNMNPNSTMGNNMAMPNQFPQQQHMQMPGNPSPMSPPMMTMQPPELVHEGHRQQAVVAYEASRDVGGVVRLRVPPGKKVEHLGIKVQFIGRIDMVCTV